MTRSLLVLVLAFAAQSAVAECEFDIDVGDSLVFSVSSIEVPKICKDVTVNLTHTGGMPVAAMGHNWVLSKTADLDGIAMDGVSAGVGGNYLAPDDPRVIAATKLIGGGESTSVTFSIAALDAAESYAFFCSFPGHWAVMKGQFSVTG